MKQNENNNFHSLTLLCTALLCSYTIYIHRHTHIDTFCNMSVEFGLYLHNNIRVIDVYVGLYLVMCGAIYCIRRGTKLDVARLKQISLVSKAISSILASNSVALIFFLAPSAM